MASASASGQKEIWLQASYNPIMDLNGEAVKVVMLLGALAVAITAGRRRQTGAAVGFAVLTLVLA